ncbi:MAG: hypothetical protein F4138_08050 [Acidimicrobiia bacterium]|nr:hypothetical protein [Acidimicrobiia bacterium]MYC57620.1 hypothetical protein [Acidimicrobiia bacterium]MYG94910.1 hypothetical protein [Acidimicrobiia bacterium]MYI31249.1 hypothetical protein [Acidimicrobiia bacterium]
MDLNPAPNNNQMALKGMLLVLALIAAGAFVLARGLDDDNSTTATSQVTPTATSAPSEHTQSPAPAETPEPSDNDPSNNQQVSEDPEPADPPATQAPDDPSSGNNDSDEPLLCRNPATIQVLVANSTNVVGAAGRLSTELNTLNYVTLSPVNAQPQTGSAFYYRAGYEVDAMCIASKLGVNEGPFFVISDPPPGGIPRDRLGNASVLIIIGPDNLAQRSS